jgi:hypothetical protein
MRTLVAITATAALACLAMTLSAACINAGTPPSGGGDAGGSVGSPCTSTSDCNPEALCGFPVDAGCAAQGVCVPQDLTCTMDGPVVCDCTGAPVGLACIWGPGYAPVPIPSEKPGCVPDAGIFD